MNRRRSPGGFSKTNAGTFCRLKREGVFKKKEACRFPHMSEAVSQSKPHVHVLLLGVWGSSWGVLYKYIGSEDAFLSGPSCRLGGHYCQREANCCSQQYCRCEWEQEPRIS